MLTSEQCKVGTKVICRSDLELVDNYGVIVRYNGKTDYAWVEWYPSGDVCPVALRVIDLYTEILQVGEESSIDGLSVAEPTEAKDK